ncbi:MAG: flagellar export chaperone FlgN [Pirellulales bacterium]
MEESTSIAWDTELAEMLGELSATQDELLAVLGEKRRRIATGATDGLDQIQLREQRVLERLEQCHQRRSALLEQAGAAGLPNDSIRSLAASLPDDQRGDLGDRVKTATTRMNLLRHQSLANWVLAQRALVHLSQMIEIIATGGRLQPTYGEGASSMATGNLIDQAG